MVTQATPTEHTAVREVPFGVNDLRLDARQWIAVAIIVIAFMLLAPVIWTKAERFDPPPDYRIPYALSSDYWLYERRVETAANNRSVVVLGDSVVWGEYVRADGTLSHFLSQESEGRIQFANCGLNGIFPLAMEGLISHYAGGLHGKKVILHFNPLWMSSPKADLSTPNEETFNHPSLVPQGYGKVPCYRADAATKLGIVAQRDIGFFGWVNHVDALCFDQKSLPNWTLQQDDRDPPGTPNAWINPLSRLTEHVPEEPALDPQRGPASPRHRPWNSRGQNPQSFEWVMPKNSLQWHAFQRTVQLLRERGNDLMVIVGPFNEHIIAPDQRSVYASLRNEVVSWLAHQSVPLVAPAVLPREEYADASHPLTQGYQELAGRLWNDRVFQNWIANSQPH